MKKSQAELRDEVRFRILGLLNENPSLSQRQLAQEVGVSLGKLNYLIQALAEKGLIKLGNFTASNDKRRYAYILTRRGISEKAAMTKRFLERKKAEYEALRAEIDALETELASGASEGELGKSSEHG